MVPPTLGLYSGLVEVLARQRVLLYVVAGLVVLGVGAWGLFSGEGGAESGGRLVVEPLPASFGEDSSGQAPSGSDGASGSTTTELPFIYVQVAGAVRRPGVYRVDVGSRVFEVIRKAGGVTAEGEEHALPLAVELSDGAKVVVPEKGAEEGSESEVLLPSGVTGGLSVPRPGGGSGSPLSLNHAALSELQTLPGIGPKTAEKIIAYRDANGGFASVDELQDIPGIGSVTMGRLRDLVEP